MTKHGMINDGMGDIMHCDCDECLEGVEMKVKRPEKFIYDYAMIPLTIKDAVDLGEKKGYDKCYDQYQAFLKANMPGVEEIESIILLNSGLGLEPRGDTPQTAYDAKIQQAKFKIRDIAKAIAKRIGKESK